MITRTLNNTFKKRKINILQCTSMNYILRLINQSTSQRLIKKKQHRINVFKP